MVQLIMPNKELICSVQTGVEHRALNRLQVRTRLSPLWWCISVSEGTAGELFCIKYETPQELWKAFIQLPEAEDAFRIQKHDLQL